jgi:hypothetical protein
VTTSHVFWPNERRRVSFLLPNSQPNFAFLSRQCTARGGGAGAGAHPRKVLRPKSVHGILFLLVPCPILGALKKIARGTAAQFQAVCIGSFT